MSSPKACIIIIGNEILSGHTQDKNVRWLATHLNESGVQLAHVRIVPDDEDIIADTVNEVRKQYDYVFTTGGIGPTHDDVTAKSIAKAFGVPLKRDKEVEKLLRDNFPPHEMTTSRLKMADFPEGAVLITNPISLAPGFRMDNVFVLAGIPSIMQAMFVSARRYLEGGSPVISRTINVLVAEGTIADGVADVQNQHPDVEIGSYPMKRGDQLVTSLVLRSPSEEEVNAAANTLSEFIASMGYEEIDIVVESPIEDS